MRIIAKRTLREFWERHPDVKDALSLWHDQVSKEDWDAPAKMLALHSRVSVISGGRAVFRIKGNSYRMVAWINYRRRTVYIKWLGTHDEYDRIDVETV